MYEQDCKTKLYSLHESFISSPSQTICQSLYQAEEHSWRYLGVEIRALLHEGAYGEPETVGEWELVLNQVVLLVTGVGVVPLVGGEARHYEHGDGHQDIRC